MSLSNTGPRGAFAAAPRPVPAMAGGAGHGAPAKRAWGAPSPGDPLAPQALVAQHEAAQFGMIGLQRTDSERGPLCAVGT